MPNSSVLWRGQYAAAVLDQMSDSCCGDQKVALQFPPIEEQIALPTHRRAEEKNEKRIEQQQLSLGPVICPEWAPDSGW